MDDSHTDVVGPQIKSDSDSPSQAKKISAYYSLVFPHFTFYIQTLSITIGRRIIPSTNAAAAASSSSSAAEPAQVDVDLGALKSVSRLHAKIEYDEDDDRFVLLVIGRNGAWVDGVWSGSGSRAPLGERSQIQIASRTFHFVLPPPPPPEDTPSPSSQSSSANNRPRSPSVDITSISPPSSLPSHSPPPRAAKLPPPPPEPQLSPPPAAANVATKSTAKSTAGKSTAGKSTAGKSTAGKSTTKTINPKKRKKSTSVTVEVASPPPPAPKEKLKPEEMPPKPALTYAQLIYRAIKAMDGKATLQEICTWIMNEYEFYRYSDGGAWMSSVRHNLSSGRAFKKMERCGGDRGKGFFWSLDNDHLHTLEEQEAKNALASQSNPTDSNGKTIRRRDKGAPLSEPALKRSVKGGPLPPPLTSVPLPMKALSSPTAVLSSTMGSSTPGTSTTGASTTGTNTPTPLTPVATGVFAYNVHPHHSRGTIGATGVIGGAGAIGTTPTISTPTSASTSVASGYSGTPMSAPNPYAALMQPQWGLQQPQHQQHQQQQQQRNLNSATHVPVAAKTVVSPRLGAAMSPLGGAQGAVASSSTLGQVQLQHPAASSTSTSTSNPPTTTPSNPSAPTAPSAPDVVIPILLGPIPPTHPDYSPTHPNNSARQGYMVLHERTMILDPDVFSGLSAEMLRELEKLGARQALVVLTGHMVRALKERRARGRREGRGGRGRGRGGVKNVGGGGAGAGAAGAGVGGGGGQGRKQGGIGEGAGTQGQTPVQAQTQGAGQAVKASNEPVPMTVDSEPPVTVPVPNGVHANAHGTSGDVGSPILIVDDSDEDGRVAKKRKVDDPSAG